MGREAALGPVSVLPNVRALALQRAAESFNGSTSQYLRALVYADLFNHGLMGQTTDEHCPSCNMVTRHNPSLAADDINMHRCVECGETHA